MEAVGKLGVIAATTLAGVNTIPREARNDTCSFGCAWLDSGVTSEDVLAPWILTGCLMVCLFLPTIVLESRQAERGVQLLFGFFARLISLLMFSMNLGPATAYAVALHATVYNLLSFRHDPSLVGGAVLWAVRYPVVVGILISVAYIGPPISLVQWDGSAPVACAASAHLLGCLLPDLVSFSQGLTTRLVMHLLEKG